MDVVGPGIREREKGKRWESCIRLIIWMDTNFFSSVLHPAVMDFGWITCL